MHLKHIALQGYKSFADRTEFEFPRGITAVIGPNGTGKSNIADAIRWALGERSMSTLRAKSSADMIFFGGDGRSRAGMAEVSLTFDNTDASLPIDFSEVTVTRRAYRSGENEYLINGSQVLLRDVEELLAESSLSERTYTVIGQGLVDAALSLRPQERRALFEEAAGVTLYRSRREKTIDRLDETERNLDRVYDIISEVAPRQKRLQRDAVQVEEHRRLTAHLERLQRTWYGHRWGQRQAELARALEQAAGLEERLGAQREEASRLSGHLSEVREREGELRGRLRDWYRRSADLHEHVDQARRKLAVSEERVRLLEMRREELLDEIGPLTVQQDQQAEQVAELDDGIQELVEELATRRRRFAEVEQKAAKRAETAEEWEQRRAQVEQELGRHREQLADLDQELSEAREEISHLVSEKVVAEERARQLESRRTEALAEIEPLREEEREHAEHIVRHQAELEVLEQSVTDREGRVTDLEAALRASREAVREPDEERRRVAAAVRERRREVEALDGALDRVQKKEAALSGERKALERVRTNGDAYGSGVQKLLAADLNGVLGPLAAMIEVPPEWETAIGAALGSDLRAVVLEQRATVARVHGMLEEEGGRLTLLALDGLLPAGFNVQMPANALSAAAIVKCEERVRPVVDVLLSTIALCDDLLEARGLQPDLPPGSCCVTRDGIVLRADGAYIVGRGDGGSGLALQRARRELRAQLAEVRREIADLTDRRHAAVEEALSLESRLEEIDRRVANVRQEEERRLQEEVNEARTTLAVAREALRHGRSVVERRESELERVRSRRRMLQRQAGELETKEAAEIERARALELALSQVEVPEDASSAEGAECFRAQFQQARRRLTVIEGERRRTSERIAALGNRLKELAERAMQARAEAARFERETLSGTRTAVAVTEASLESRRQALERESVLLERIRSQVEARRERAEELKLERDALLGRIEELRRRATRLEDQLNEVRVRVQPAEDELEELNIQQTRLEEEGKRAHQRVSSAEEHYSRAQLRLERKRDELRILADRIDEDLGLVELELGESFTAQAPLPMRPLVSELPVVEQLPEGLEAEMQFVKKRLRQLGAINPNAPEELAEVAKRHSFLTDQAGDLEVATAQLRRSVRDLDNLMEMAFKETFDAVAEGFSRVFTRLFEGGEARVTLTDPDDLLNTGVDIIARPPGKRSQRLALLSGGERALTATALLFSLLQISPTPFCVLDEVDAMLDEANVGRFCAQLEDLARDTQFILITHNRGTVESAETVYGVSMGSNAVSQVVSLKMDGEVDVR